MAIGMGAAFMQGEEVDSRPRARGRNDSKKTFPLGERSRF
jgi:hypothetical protein